MYLLNDGTNPELPKLKKPFIVQANVSLFAVGAVLSQLDDENVEHPVAYCSRTLNPHKKNYTVTEKECLAVIYACKQFRVYIHGTRFSVVTDHALLRWLHNLKEPEGRLARWALKLQAYNFEILHRPGASHQNADGLSRLPVICTIILTADKLYIKMVYNKFSDEPESVQKTLSFLRTNTVLENEVFYKLIDGKKLIFPRTSARTSIILCAHKATGHGGFFKTNAELKDKYFWESINFDIHNVI